MESRLVVNDRSVSWFLSIFIISNITVFSLKHQILYYIFLISTLIIVMFKSKIININFSMLILYFICFISIYINDVPPFFKAWATQNPLYLKVCHGILLKTNLHPIPI